MALDAELGLPCPPQLGATLPLIALKFITLPFILKCTKANRC